MMLLPDWIAEQPPLLNLGDPRLAMVQAEFRVDAPVVAPGCRNSFYVGRVCAVRAMHQLRESASSTSIADLPRSPAIGIEALSEIVGTDPKSGAPIWPQGWVGSITHHQKQGAPLGVAAAIVSRDPQVHGLGVDLESVMPAERAAKIARKITHRSELSSANLAYFGGDLALLTTLIFCAKESIYKALYPTVQRRFGFYAVQIIDWDPDHQRFIFELCESLAPGLSEGWRGTGIYATDSGLVATGLVLAAEQDIGPSHDLLATQ